jgi:chromate transporter
MRRDSSKARTPFPIATIFGACVLLSKIAIADRFTALIAIGSLFVLFRLKVSYPLLVRITAVIALIAFPRLAGSNEIITTAP